MKIINSQISLNLQGDMQDFKKGNIKYTQIETNIHIISNFLTLHCYCACYHNLPTYSNYTKLLFIPNITFKSYAHE